MFAERCRDVGRVALLSCLPFFGGKLMVRSVCPFFKDNLCSLSSKRCEFHGRHMKYKTSFSAVNGLTVTWQCPELAGLPDLEV